MNEDKCNERVETQFCVHNRCPLDRKQKERGNAKKMNIETARQTSEILITQGRNDGVKNKAVYTTAPVADGWAGAVMIWVGAIIFMKYSYLNFSTFK